LTPVRTTTRRFGDVAVGDVLPELPIPLTRTVIVATAIASRDYQDVHHDPGLAVERGSEDIFMNILSTNGFVGRYVTDWAGPGAVIEKVSIRLGAPNYPGDTMVLTGTVTEAQVPEGRADGRGVVEIALRGANRRGDHVTGTVRVALPLGTDGEGGAGS
jgi:acyl dehydratase